MLLGKEKEGLSVVNHKVRNTILSLWLLTLIGTGGILLWKYQKKEQNEALRAQTIEDMTNKIRSGEIVTFTVDPDAVPVSGEDPVGRDLPFLFPVPDMDLSSSGAICPSSGEEIPSFSLEATSFDSANSVSSENASDSYTLHSCGVISIPSIDCLLPLWDGAGSVELRYGAGKVPNGAFPGYTGNLVILGHRMKKYGSLFNRLGEVGIDDMIRIETESGAYTYMVDTILTIDPSELSFYMQNEGDACRITLITCTPVGTGTDRLLILGHLISG